MRGAKHLAMLGLAALTLVPTAEAQVAVGDSLWRLGRIDEAAAAYRRALDDDRLSVRANFRLAQTLAWSSNIDSALVLLRAARVRVPDDPDLLTTEALYLSWGKRFDEAIVRYDSVITAHPGPDFVHVRIARARTLSWAGRLAEAGRGYAAVLAQDSTDRDARYGLAQVAAWSGDLESAATRYEALLADDPNEVRTLVGLGNLRIWQQRPGDARRLAQRAYAADSANGEVRELRRAVRTAYAPRAEVSSDYSEDSERNVNRWQALRLNATVLNGIRAGVSLAQLEATDPARDARRTMVEGSLGVPVWKGSVTAVLGLRKLAPAPLTVGGAAAPERTTMSGRITLQQRVRPSLALSATVARWPFDEIASVTPLALDVTQGELSADWRVTPTTNVFGSLGLLDWSDGNAKRTWAVRATRQLPKRFSVGAFLTGFGFDQRAARYFSPPRFLSGEVTAGWSYEDPRWSLGFGGGYGAQRVDTLDVQDQWHADARLARTWASNWQVELRGGRSTSAAASAVGAYSYSTLGLSLRRTF
ncbi:MAG: tetratricopeptide repeat protein [Planctomycetes bacterium]|nr:tetratricopeptide repeat protein [Planctomycetota bacterium]